MRPRIATLMLLAASTTGCASLPSGNEGAVPEGFRTLKDQPHYRVHVRDGSAAWPAPARFQLPRASLAEGSHAATITDDQAALIATHAARTVCIALAPWVEWTGGEDAGKVALAVRHIGASSSALAATSAVLDAAVPGPFRLPAGLGALAIDTRVEGATGSPLLELQWARGANPLLHRARASAIGDAWELAPSHARALRDALRSRGALAQPQAVRQANEAMCEQQFGRVSVAGRAASLFVPLPPEAIAPDTPREPEPQER